MTEDASYIYRFALQPPTSLNVDDESALNEMIRRQLEALLKVIILTKGGKRVEVDGFVNLNERYRLAPHPIFREHQKALELDDKNHDKPQG